MVVGSGCTQYGRLDDRTGGVLDTGPVCIIWWLFEGGLDRNYKIAEEDESLSGDLFRILVLSGWSQKGRPDGRIGGASNDGPVFVMVVSGWPP